MNKFDFLARNDVTPQNLLETLRCAYIDAELDDDGDVVIKDHLFVYVLVDKEEHLVKLITAFPVGVIPDDVKFDFLNELGKYRCATFAMKQLHDEYLVHAHYEILYKGGLLKTQFVHACKDFMDITRLALYQERLTFAPQGLPDRELHMRRRGRKESDA
ncbi:hypothetical protein Dxin01_02432 [Deinococcus xinjiangensis]|uniref:Sensory transduction regulator n=1 Tax=Deinococcus xinjiangensis TaxID=457454 RepID=A0ABP9VH79_9DEIO